MLGAKKNKTEPNSEGTQTSWCNTSVSFKFSLNLKVLPRPGLVEKTLQSAVQKLQNLAYTVGRNCITHIAEYKMKLQH